MIASRQIAIFAAAVALLSMSACGGGDSGSRSTPADAPVPPRVIARANAICRDFLRETRQIGKAALRNPPAITLDLTTERLVKPSIPVLERVADRQQALEPKAHSALFNLYANIFDPVVVLAQERLDAGRAEDFTRSKRLEEMLTDLGLEQERVARAAGLQDCDVDFQHVLLSSLNE